jgi:lambda family phage portal protein
VGKKKGNKSKSPATRAAQKTRVATVPSMPSSVAPTSTRAHLGPLGIEAGRALSRRLAAIPSQQAEINALVRSYGPSALARARHLAINNPYVTSAREGFVAAVIGEGIKLSSLAEGEAKAEVMALWSAWQEVADSDGMSDFYGMQAIIAGELFDAGECFIRIRQRRKSDGLPVPMQLEIIPSEMVPVNYNRASSSGARIESGIEFDALNRRVAYWVLPAMPGALGWTLGQSSGLPNRIPAEEIIHVMIPRRGRQCRGVPYGVSAVTTLAMLDLYDDAELERKRTAALFAGFITHPTGEGEDGPLGAGTGPGAGGAHQEPINLEPGALIDLLPGEGIEFSKPSDMGSGYEDFQFRTLTRICAGLNVPYPIVTGDLRRANYGSMRAGLVEFRRRVHTIQRQVFVFQLCRPVFNAVIDRGVLSGALSVQPRIYLIDPSLWRAAKWIPPKEDWIDPLKDLQAEKLAVDSGFKSRSDVIEAEGHDPVETDNRIKADKDRAEELGIAFDRGAILDKTDAPKTVDPGLLDTNDELVDGETQTKGSN